MSWGEIKKAVNSDLNEPLNYLQWLSDLSIMGKFGHTWYDAQKMISLATKSPSARLSRAAIPFLLEYIIQGGAHVGTYFKQLTGSTSSVFDNLSTISDVASNADAMTIIANSNTAMKAIVENSLSASIAVASNGVSIGIISNVESAMTTLVKSPQAMGVCLNSISTMQMFFNKLMPIRKMFPFIVNNSFFTVATSAGIGYIEYSRTGANFDHSYQSVPIDFSLVGTSKVDWQLTGSSSIFGAIASITTGPSTINRAAWNGTNESWKDRRVDTIGSTGNSVSPIDFRFRQTEVNSFILKVRFFNLWGE
ncbi:hypothetical protein BHU72_12045 [Desulfuribacillus stibiiarsenatis]|uniref:Uncharacterized protein n=1 Tax=Desulfuribacillus stibiiarsenatis TaxID=1390249 RepID=A0A1E5L8E3_9FIRM|nr:hypothetical protein [Desulfuribacillus stibiiarsenatis]OEH86259.1 hypothetical protein BHU72_12045 [Desulfuribacillus stibiiarsenatis]